MMRAALGRALLGLVAGAVAGGLGVLGPLRRSTLGAVALSLVAASGFLATVFVTLQGTPAGWTRSTWWALGLGTLALGAVLADKVQPSDR